MHTSTQVLISQLGQTGAASSFVESPFEWLQANTDTIRNTAEKLQLSDLIVASLADLLYPRFFVYLFAHFKYGDHEQALQLFKALEDKQADLIQLDDITQIIFYRSILSQLLDFLRQLEDSHSSHNDIDFVEKIVELDLVCLVVRLLIILHDKSRRKLLLNQDEHRAQTLLDLLQFVLDSRNFNSVQAPILRAAYDLAKKSGLYPSCLLLHGVEHRGNYPIYRASFGDIWKGNIRGHPVAIKVMWIFNPSDVDTAIKAYIKEAVLWRQLYHPNVLPFYGIHQCADDVCLVSPWMTNGNINQYLKRTPDADRLQLLRDVACGLDYLHSFDPPITHGDLRGDNILITPAQTACLANFTLSTFVQDSELQITPTSSIYQFGALRWRSPELFKGRPKIPEPRISLATDIYAFGCVCYEIFVGKPCFSELNDWQVLQTVIGGSRPSRPNVIIDDVLWDLMERCWLSEPESRPTSKDVLKNLATSSDASVHAPSWNESIMNYLKSPPLSHLPLHRTTTQEPIGTNTFISPECSVHGSASCPSDFLFLDRPNSIVSRESSSPSEIEVHSIEETDIVIALMGPTGTGKSSFINTAACQDIAPADDGLDSCTQGVCAYAIVHPRHRGRRIILVDTPGFDDSDRTDYDVLKDIAHWLTQTYKQGVTLSGLLYFHRISERRFRGTPLRNLTMFQAVCGEHALQNVILITTMWDQVVEEVGLVLESQLQKDVWAPMLSYGCRMVRYHRGVTSSWDIIDQFDIDRRRPVELQDEMVNQGKGLHQTAAFQVLIKWWHRTVMSLRTKARRSPSQGGPTQAAVVRKQLAIAIRQKRELSRGYIERWNATIIEKIKAVWASRRVKRQDNAQRSPTPADYHSNPRIHRHNNFLQVPTPAGSHSSPEHPWPNIVHSQRIIMANLALDHATAKISKIGETFSSYGIQKGSYFIQTGFDEEFLQQGYGTLEVIYVHTDFDIFREFSQLLVELGKIFSPFPSTLCTPSTTYYLPVGELQAEQEVWTVIKERGILRYDFHNESEFLTPSLSIGDEGGSGGCHSTSSTGAGPNRTGHAGGSITSPCHSSEIPSGHSCAPEDGTNGGSCPRRGGNNGGNSDSGGGGGKRSDRTGNQRSGENQPNNRFGDKGGNGGGGGGGGGDPGPNNSTSEDARNPDATLHVPFNAVVRVNWQQEHQLTCQAFTTKGLNLIQVRQSGDPPDSLPSPYPGPLFETACSLLSITTEVDPQSQPNYTLWQVKYRTISRDLDSHRPSNIMDYMPSTSVAEDDVRRVKTERNYMLKMDVTAAATPKAGIGASATRTYGIEKCTHRSKVVARPITSSKTSETVMDWTFDINDDNHRTFGLKFDDKDRPWMKLSYEGELPHLNTDILAYWATSDHPVDGVPWWLPVTRKTLPPVFKNFLHQVSISIPLQNLNGDCWATHPGIAAKVDQPLQGQKQGYANGKLSVRNKHGPVSDLDVRFACALYGEVKPAKSSADPILTGDGLPPSLIPPQSSNGQATIHSVGNTETTPPTQTATHINLHHPLLSQEMSSATELTSSSIDQSGTSQSSPSQSSTPESASSTTSSASGLATSSKVRNADSSWRQHLPQTAVTLISRWCQPLKQP